MFSRSNDNKNKAKFIEDLNKIPSLENAVLERLERRIHKSTGKSSQNLLQSQIREIKEQQNRLRKLIAYHGGTPTGSKRDLLSLNLLTDVAMDKMKKKKNITLNDTMTNSKSNVFGGGNTKSNNIPSITPQESEILNMKEDALIKKEEISAYKKVLKIAKKVNDKNTTIVLKQSLKENESTYAKIKTFEHEMSNEIKSNDTAHHEYFYLGSTIADMLTSYWNSKENPSKVYLFNRRVHHGTIGALLGLSGLYKTSPMITDILSGLGAGLQRDDYNDFKEWWSFKKKEDEARER
jgi:ferritin-like metal-binding protein YciE